MQSNSNTWERKVLFGVAVVLIIVFISILYFPPQSSEFAKPILKLLAASVAGVIGYFLTGSLSLSGILPTNGLKVKAGGAIGLFILVLIIFDPGTPVTSPGNNLFEKTVISNAIFNPVSTTPQGYPVVATDNGNGAKLSVNLSNISNRVDRSKYNLIALARINGSQTWDSQGVKPLSESPPPFELTLWHDPENNAGDKKLYEAITIISSTFNHSGSKTLTEDDVKRFEEKRSDVLTFYRDDSL